MSAAASLQHCSRAGSAAAAPRVVAVGAAAPRHTSPPGRHHLQPPRRQHARQLRAAAAPAPAPPAGAPPAAAPVLPAESSEQQDALMAQLAAFLEADLPHLFDDVGIDASRYEPGVVFEDPITKYNGIQGYLFNIAFLRRVFTPTFTLHAVRRTAPLELTTRWTMRMRLAALWDPTLTFTGTSIMRVNPQTGRFSQHVDTWDAVTQQRFFSLEAFAHMLRQAGDLRQGPRHEAAGEYEVLLKRARYEVRRYSRLPQDGGGGGGGGGVAAHEGAAVAVGEFSGPADGDAAAAAERALRAALAADGLAPVGAAWQLVRGGGGEGWRASPALARNEVLVPLAEFELP